MIPSKKFSFANLFAKDKVVLKNPNQKELYRFNPTKDKIGSGSLGDVYIAKTSKKELVALKILYDQIDYDQEVDCNLMILNSLDLCSSVFLCMLDYFETGNKKYPFAIVFPLLNNYETLDKVILSKQEYQIIMNKLIDAVKKLHDYGILHSDINMENIMVSKNPLDVKLIDLGNCLQKNKESQFMISLFSEKDIQSLSSILKSLVN